MGCQGKEGGGIYELATRNEEHNAQHTASWAAQGQQRQHLTFQSSITWLKRMKPRSCDLQCFDIWTAQGQTAWPFQFLAKWQEKDGDWSGPSVYVDKQSTQFSNTNEISLFHKLGCHPLASNGSLSKWIKNPLLDHTLFSTFFCSLPSK